jgi:response regulator RpfG family c-di-GMP phosphodiesterase
MSDEEVTKKDGRNLDDLIRQYRQAEEKKEEEMKKSPDVEPEMSSFILQHYDRVLILEPNEAAGEAAFRLLKAEGYNAEWETERQAAIEILETEKFTTLIVSEGFSADGLIIRDTLMEKGIQVNLRVVKDFGTAILGHEESSSLKETRRSFYHLLGFCIRLIESYHPPMVGHAKEVARLSREVAVRMQLLPEIIDGITVTAYMHEISELHERYHPFWDKSEDIFGDLEIKLPDWNIKDLTEAIRYPFPIAESLKHLQERFDGKGYPDGLSGENIPIASRVVAPIDIYLNMVSGDMGPGVARGEAIDQLIIDSGASFDPAVIETLVSLLKTELAEREGTEYRETILFTDTFGDEDLVKIQLREEGYKVFSCNSVQDSLEKLEAEKPFMIIADIDLTNGTGFQLLDNVRKKPDFRETPFLIMSARSDSSFISKALRAGADDFLPRPIPAEVLLAKVARHINRAKGRTAGLAERRGVTGSLRDLGILEIIQILAAGSKNAMLILNSGEQEARVALEDGRIVFARLGTDQGEDAFYKFIGWDEGDFTIHMNVAPPLENITIKNDMLLLEGFRRLDEIKR